MVLDLRNRHKGRAVGHAPEDKDQALVKTPYGKGQVIRTRKDKGSGKVTMREIELLDWKQQPAAASSSASKGPARPNLLYSPQQFPSVPAAAGDDVMTQYGRGQITEVRADGTCVVDIKSWRLAGRSTVKCYMPLTQVQVLRPKKRYEMNVYDKVERAQELKQQANQWFAKKEFEKALNMYAQAVDFVRWVQHDHQSTNEVRADLLVIMITCSNNAATCCYQLHKWEETKKFGKNALVLLDAMYEKRRDSKIMAVLSKEGKTESHIFGTWKAKTCLLIARAHAEKGDTHEAIEVARKGLEVVAEFKKDSDPMFKQLASQEKQIRKLLLACKERLKMEKQKEKKRAKAMFGESSKAKKAADTPKPGGGKATATTKSTSPVMSSRSLGASPSAASKQDDSASAQQQQPPQEASTTRGILTTPLEQSDPKPNTPRRKQRVSFADGSKPGEDEDEESFLDEHKEALFIVGSVALGVAATWLLGRSRR